MSTAACNQVGNVLENLEYLTILCNKASAHLFLDKVSMLFAITNYECTVSQAVSVLSLVPKAHNLFGFYWVLLVCLFLIIDVFGYILYPRSPPL